MSNINNKGIAVVTGASSGLGKVYADRLAAQGYQLLLVARRENRLKELSAELEAKYGRPAEILVADLTLPDDLNMLATMISTDSEISMLVNNAGTATLSASDQTTTAQAQAMIDLNVTALTRLSLAAIPAFKQRNAGALVNIGSVLGFFNLPVSTTYSGTKAFVLGFTRGLQEEVTGTNVKVQLVMPGATATEIWEVGGVPLDALDASIVMTAEDCVDAALAGLANGEIITIPPVEDIKLWETFDASRQKLAAATQSGKPGTRYLQTK